MNIVWIKFDTDATKLICGQIEMQLLDSRGERVFVRLHENDAYRVIKPKMVADRMYDKNPSLYEENFVDIGKALQNMNQMLNSFFQLSANEPITINIKHMFAENGRAYIYDKFCRSSPAILQMTRAHTQFEYDRYESALALDDVTKCLNESCWDVLEMYGQIGPDNIPELYRHLLNKYVIYCTPLGDIQCSAKTMPVVDMVLDYVGHVVNVSREKHDVRIQMHVSRDTSLGRPYYFIQRYMGLA